MEDDYRPAPDSRRLLTGTTSVLATSLLEAGPRDLRRHRPWARCAPSRQQLTELFIELVEHRCAGHGLRLVSPRDPDRRGSQVAFAHPEGYAHCSGVVRRQGDRRLPRAGHSAFRLRAALHSFRRCLGRRRPVENRARRTTLAAAAIPGAFGGHLNRRAPRLSIRFMNSWQHTPTDLLTSEPCKRARRSDFSCLKSHLRAPARRIPKPNPLE